MTAQTYTLGSAVTRARFGLSWTGGCAMPSTVDPRPYAAKTAVADQHAPIAADVDAAGGVRPWRPPA